MVETTTLEKMRAWRNMMPPITPQRRERVYLRFPLGRLPRDVRVEDAHGNSVQLQYDTGKPYVSAGAVLPLTVTLDGRSFLVERVDDAQ